MDDLGSGFAVSASRDGGFQKENNLSQDEVEEKIKRNKRKERIKRKKGKKKRPTETLSESPTS